MSNTSHLTQRMFNVTKGFTKKRIIGATFLLLLLTVSFYIGKMGASPSEDEIIINPDYSFWKAFDIIVGKVASTYHAVSGTTGESLSSGSNDDPVIQYAIDTLSAAGGGSVGIRAAAYSASVVLKNGVRLVIEAGATGITVSANAGATCQLWDYNAGRIRYWKTGTITTDINMDSGEFWYNSWNVTIAQVIEDYPSLSWKGLWNVTVQELIETYGIIEWQDSWNATVEDLIFENLVWQGSYNSTVIELIENNQDFSWQGIWNATVEAIVDTYNIDVWRDSWNSTVTEIVADYLSTLDIFAYPQQPYSYEIFKIGSTYYAKNGTTGQIDFQSTNARTVIKNAINNASLIKGSVFIKGGDYPISLMIDANFNNTFVTGDPNARLYLPNNQPNNAEAFRIFYIINCENFTITGFTVDGNFLNQIYNVNSNLIWIENCRHFTFSEMNVLNAQANGIWVGSLATDESCYDFHIDSNHVVECKWNGISLVVGVEGALVHDFWITNNYVKGSNDIGINPAGYEGVITTCYNGIIVHNIIDGSSPHYGYGSGEPDSLFGIRTEGSINCLYSQNVISNVFTGILDSNAWGFCGNNTYSENLICTNGNDANGYAGFQIFSSYNEISGNHIHTGYGEWTVGIELYASHNLIDSNFLYNDLGSAHVAGISPDINSNYTICRDNTFASTFASPLGDIHFDDWVYINNYDLVTATIINPP